MPPTASRRFSKSLATYGRRRHLHLVLNLVIAGVLQVTPPARAASYYSQCLADSRAVHLAGPSGGDDTAAVQQAINQVQETGGQGIVFLPEGRYSIKSTFYAWPEWQLVKAQQKRGRSNGFWGQGAFLRRHPPNC
jgi:hypothetical protein